MTDVFLEYKLYPVEISQKDWNVYWQYCLIEQLHISEITIIEVLDVLSKVPDKTIYSRQVRDLLIKFYIEVGIFFKHLEVSDIYAKTRDNPLMKNLLRNFDYFILSAPLDDICWYDVEFHDEIIFAFNNLFILLNIY